MEFKVPRLRLAAAIGMALTSTLLGVLPVLAHEDREVGDYTLVVGFIDEPVFVGQKSGLEVLITRGEEPVEGLETSLQAEATKDGETRELPLSPRFGAPGWYQSYFFPTVEGPYTFRIFGDIEDLAIDESFTSSEEGFDEVEAVTAGQFPEELPAMAELAEQAQRGADSAGLATLALGLGAAGLVAGMVAIGLALAGRRRTA